MKLEKRGDDLHTTKRIDLDESLGIIFHSDGHNSVVDSGNGLSFYVKSIILPGGEVALEIVLPKDNLYENEPYSGENVERYILSDGIGADKMIIQVGEIPARPVFLAVQIKANKNQMKAEAR